VQLHQGRILYSATDLNNFLACRHLTSLDLDVLREGLARPHPFAGQRDLLARLGDKHELEYLARLYGQGLDVAEIAKDAPLEAAARETAAAMRSGREVIYQATFLDGDWMGRADFLRRVDGNRGRGLWNWHYEVEDTKLARHTQPYFLLQLCYYSEHVARITGVVPEYVYVVLGDGLRREFRHDDFAAYYRAVKAAFLTRVESQNLASYPLPVPHCNLCDWSDDCRRRWRDDDHLKLVANITSVQTARLNASGIATLAQLATSGEDRRPPKMERATFAKLVRQARLQVAQREADAAGGAAIPPEILAHDDDDWQRKGFALLPPPSKHDLYFDMEGDPYYEVSASLEYLFGVYAADEHAYTAFWGCDRTNRPLHDRLAEKRAFEDFVDFVTERRRRYPEMHVYHYAAYEKTKLKELAVRHATREDEVDDMLRGGLLVDLYTVVRQSIAVGQPSYSIKNLELYFGKRGDAGVKSGDQSILQFELWLAGRNDVGARDDALLEDLQKYNEFDCVSTHKLHGWLLSLRDRARRETGVDIPFFSGAAAEEKKERVDTYGPLKDELRARIPEDFDPDDDDDAAQETRRLWMLLQMLEYHWREDKPVYWRFFDRCDGYLEDPSDLLDDAEVLIGLEFASVVPDKKSFLETYRAPIQEFKEDDGDCYAPISREKVGALVDTKVGDQHVTVTIRRGATAMKVAMEGGIVMRTIFPAGPIRDAIANFARSALDGDAARRYGAAFDILSRALPRRTGGSRGPIQPKHPDPDAIGAIVSALSDSYLFVQGPPGSGKTYAAARLIASVLERGGRAGISANSHRAMHNLLEEVERVARERGVDLRGIKKTTKGKEDSIYTSLFGTIENRDSLSDERANLFAGTAWALCPEFEDRPLDVLFIDEAGQVSLPNALAMSTVARNVVLLGDPLQLPHVSHTSHPGNVGCSVLEHLLGNPLRPVQEDRGVLLTSTFRMNEPICSYISDLMYEGRLHPAPGRELQRVNAPGLPDRGLHYIPVEHANNRQRSEEEASAIAERAAELLRGTVTDVRGETRALVASDVIVVTPYNAQVRCIARALRDRGLHDIAVGTVDKFQGREAHVVFFSTAASTAEDAPRGIGFLFDRNRLNVAISRARALAIMVGSPALLSAECRSVEEARAMNGVLSFVERAARA
jgi:uncharacterized protein